MLERENEIEGKKIGKAYPVTRSKVRKKKFEQLSSNGAIGLSSILLVDKESGGFWEYYL